MNLWKSFGLLSLVMILSYVVRCAMCYQLYNLKNVKNTHGGALLLSKLQDLACNFNKSNTPPWVFLTFFKLCKWYQTAQRILCISSCIETVEPVYYWSVSLQVTEFLHFWWIHKRFSFQKIMSLSRWSK